MAEQEKEKDSFMVFHMHRHITDSEPIIHRLFFWKLYKYIKP